MLNVVSMELLRPLACRVNTNVELPDCYGRWQIDGGQKGLCVFREVMMCVFRDFK